MLSVMKRTQPKQGAMALVLCPLSLTLGKRAEVAVVPQFGEEENESPGKGPMGIMISTSQRSGDLRP